MHKFYASRGFLLYRKLLSCKAKTPARMRTAYKVNVASDRRRREKLAKRVSRSFNTNIIRKGDFEHENHIKRWLSKEYSEAKSVYDIAADISEGLARVACAGEVDGEVVDLRTVLDKDCNLNIITAK